MSDFVRTTNELRPRFCTMYFRKKTSGGRAYLQIVESRREGGSVRQQVIATLGRLDDLQQSGQLERLLRSGARFADKAILAGELHLRFRSLGRRILRFECDGFYPVANRARRGRLGLEQWLL